MAEENTNKNFIVNTIEKGLHLDHAPENQPDGTARFVLNGVMESNEGDYYSYSVELANSICAELPAGYVPIGRIYMAGDEVALMLVKSDESNSQIGILKDCTYTPLIEEACLGFKLNKPVRGIFRIRNGCERNIYLVDNNNPDKAINLDRLDQYKNTAGDFVCSEFNLVACSNDLRLLFNTAYNDGGATRVGVFQVAARYTDENGNKLPFSILTRPYNVTNGNYSYTNYNQNQSVDGGLLANNDLTNKSFSFTIYNINNNYPFIELAILETSGGVSSAYVVDRIPTQGVNVLEWTYRGTEGSYVYPITTNELTIGFTKDITSVAVTQIDNSIVRANTSETYVDWVPFLRAALTTDVKYAIFTQDPDNTKRADADTSFMGDETYALGIRWIIDDCIESPVFHIPGREPIVDADLKDDGNANIHNRVDALTNNWDKELVAVTNGTPGAGEIRIRELEFINNANNGYVVYNDTNPIPRWKAFNTAIKTDNISITPGVNPDIREGGFMAYTESECESYPDTKDCDGKLLFATYDEDGVLIKQFAGDKVRHHRFPDRTLEPHFTDATTTDFTTVNVRNLKPIIYPTFPDGWNPDRLKYQLVAVPRNSSNSTVIDAGVIALAQCTRIDNTAPNGEYKAVTTNYNVLQANVLSSASGYPFDWYYTHFISPSFTHLQDEHRDSYYKLERILYGTANGLFVNETVKRFTASVFLNKSIIPGSITSGTGVDFVLGGGSIPTGPSSFPNWYYRVINHGERINFNESFLANGVATPANSINPNPLLGIRNLGSAADQQCQKGYICAHIGTQWINDFVNSANSLIPRTYNLLDELHLADGGVKEWGGYPAYYGIIKSSNLCPYYGLDAQIYRPISDIKDGLYNDGIGLVPNTISVGEFGDCHIARFDYVNTSNHLDFNGHDGYMDPFDGPANRSKSLLSNDIKFFVESPINTGLLSNDYKNNFLYYPYAQYAHNVNLLNYKDFYHNGPTDPEATGRGWQEISYIYNKDFSKLNIENAYFPIPYTYNFCSDCGDKNRYRFRWSQKSFAEESLDMFRVFNINDYKDIPAETGQIINITEYQNKLLIDTEESRWLQQASPQELQTSESTISIGTGQLFSLDPQKLYASDTGHVGSQSRFFTKINEYGMASIDARSGRIFISQDLSPKPISSAGLSSWFRENLPLNLKAQIEDITGIKQDYLDWDTPQNIYNPTGYITAVDNKFNRLIITKHDYRLTEDAISLFENEDLFLEDYKWKIAGNFIEPKENPLLFENLSFTISFAYKDMAWASWHSYIPSFYAETKFNLYSYADGIIWKHNTRNLYKKYYDTDYPHIIEVVSTSRALDSIIFDHIAFNTNAKQWDSVNKQYIDKRFITFDKALFYNSYQSSGILDLITKKESTFWTRQFQNVQSQAMIDVNEKVYSINGFKDIVVDYDEPLFTNEWDKVASEYYIDKIPNSSAIDLGKIWYEKGPMRDRYLISRLYFTIFDNVRLTTNMSLFKTNKSIR
jgi:hypothetical protein